MLEFIRLNLKAFVTDDEAISSLEYAILAVIVLGIIAAVIGGSSGSIKTLFTNMSNTLSSAAAAS